MSTGKAQPNLDFDHELPLLPLVFDLDSVGGLFERRWAKKRSGREPLAVRVEALQDVKYQPGLRCVSTYELAVGKKGSRAVGVLQVDTGGARVFLPEEDSELDRLGEAIDPECMRHRLETAPELNATLTEPPRITALRYKPRLRCALRYDLRTETGEHVLFGKMMAQGGGETMSTLSELHRQSEEHPTMPRVAPPLVYWPDLRLLLQRAVEGGDELHSIVFDERRDVHGRTAWMCTAGERLAGLHSAGHPPGPLRTLMDDVDELSGYAPAIAASDPDLARAYSQEVGRVGEAGGKGENPVPSHGAFRTDQFMIQDGELVLIDLDGYCWAEPARDIANLFAYLAWKAVRQPQHGPFVEQARARFLEGYGAVRKLPDEGRIALFEAASMLKIAGRRYRSLSWREWPLVPRLIDASRTLLNP